MRKILLLALIACFINLHHTIAQSEKNMKAVVFEEDFNGWSNIESEGWFTYSEQSWNFIDADGEAVTFFKQDAADWMMLITPEIDLTTATTLTFSHKMISSVDGMVLEVGTMTDPNDPATFTLLNIVQINSSEWTTEGSLTVLGGVTGMNHIAFNVSASSPIPYTYFGIDDVIIVDDAAATNWPSYITNLDIIADDMGANTASVSWTNPSEEADGDPLTDLDSVVVLLNDIWAHTIVNPEIGGAEMVDIDVPEPGLYIFTLTAYNDAGASVSISNEPAVWVGLDTPGEPTNVQLTVTENLISNLSWEAPTEGAHGAYFDGVVNTYKITRIDGAEYTVTGNELSFTQEMNEPGTYTYFVEGVNTSGEGSATESNAGAYYFDGYLLAEDFWVSVPALDWTNEGDGTDYFYHWPTDYAGSVKYWEMIFHPDANNPFTGLTRISSPVLNSEGNIALTLKFRHFHNWNSASYTFKIQTTSNGTDWNDVWEIEVDQSMAGESELVVIENEDVGSPTFQFAYVFEGNSSNLEFLTVDEVRLYEASEEDIVATELNLPAIIEPDDQIVPTAKMENWGYQDVDFNATLTFYQGGSAVYISEINSTIDGGGDMDLTFESWTAQEGNYTAELILTAADDDNPSNNEISEDFSVVYLNAERTLVVCEEGTGTWCGYCPGAAMGLDELVENAWPVAVIAYHSGDDYENEHGRDRLDYYEISGFPTVYFDGIESFVGGSATESMYENYLPLVEERLSIAAAVSVEIESIIFEGEFLKASITLESGSPIEGQTALIAVLAESHIPESWQNQDELNFVERGIYGGADGVSVDLSDQSESVVISIPLDPSWMMDNSELVVFVQNLTTKEIYNGNKINLMTVSTNEIAQWVAVYPNPATNEINISNSTNMEATLYDAQGKPVINTMIDEEIFRMDVSELSFGFYILELSKDGIKYQQKVLIGM